MILESLSYKFLIGAKQFTQFHYRFNIFSNEEQKERIIEVARTELNSLDHILEKIYGNKGKTEGGEVTPREIEYGFDYASTSLIGALRNERVFTQLRYVMDLDREGKPMGLKLVVTNFDTNQKRLLAVYDTIIRLPKLEFSTEAQVQIEKVNSLRTEEFLTERFLLTSKK
jgi:hypothetical protein